MKKEIGAIKIKPFKELNSNVKDFSKLGKLSHCKKFISTKTENKIEIFKLDNFQSLKKIQNVDIDHENNFGWLWLDSEKLSFHFHISNVGKIEFLHLNSSQNELNWSSFSYEIDNISQSCCFKNYLILKTNSKLFQLECQLGEVKEIGFYKVDDFMDFGVLNEHLFVSHKDSISKFNFDLTLVEEINFNFSFDKIYFSNDSIFIQIKKNLIKLQENEFKLDNIESNDSVNIAEFDPFYIENQIFIPKDFCEEFQVISLLKMENEIYTFKFDGIYKIFKNEENINEWNDLISQESNLKEIIIQVLLEGYNMEYIKEYMKFNEFENLNQLKMIVYSIIYELFSQNDFDVGITMIENSKENVDEYLKNVVFNTPDSTIRNILIKELKRRNAFNTEELASIDYLFELEEHYDEDTFSNFQKSKSILKSGELNDFGELVELEDEDEYEEEEHGLYLYVTLNWIQHWNKETRERILMEVVKEDKFDFKSRFNFYVSHFEVKKLISLIKEHQELLKENIASVC
jgi:hypothetical protein